MAIRAGYTADEWQLLEFAPLWVFTAVAGADRNIDKKEMMAFAKELAESQLFKNDLAQEVLSSTGRGLDKTMPAFGADSRTIDGGLGEVADLLDAKNEADAEGFKRALILVGRNIAESSGGGILGLGSKTSEVEMKALMICCASLRLKL